MAAGSTGAEGSAEAAAGYASACKSAPDPDLREIGSAELPVPYALTERFSGFGSGIVSWTGAAEAGSGIVSLAAIVAGGLLAAAPAASDAFLTAADGVVAVTSEVLREPASFEPISNCAGCCDASFLYGTRVYFLGLSPTVSKSSTMPCIPEVLFSTLCCVAGLLNWPPPSSSRAPMLPAAGPPF